jgi:hypothetical protein
VDLDILMKGTDCFGDVGWPTVGFGDVTMRVTVSALLTGFLGLNGGQKIINPGCVLPCQNAVLVCLAISPSDV